MGSDAAHDEGDSADFVTSTGVVVTKSDGRVYIRKLTNSYRGYKWAFAKGRVEDGLERPAGCRLALTHREWRTYVLGQKYAQSCRWR